MASWVFVDRLHSTITAKDLNEAFASHGSVNRVLMFNNATGNHVAFIEMADEGGASKAAQAVNEGSLLGELSRAVLMHGAMPADSNRT
jgi:hypothetical protein